MNAARTPPASGQWMRACYSSGRQALEDDPVSHTEHPAGSNATDRATRARWRLPTLAALVAATVATSAGSGDALDALVDGQTARRFTPITDAVLARPDAADWPNWRRTLDGWGFSPLDQINTRNVHQLQLAWSWGLHEGESQPTPLVANRTMYIPIPGGAHRPWTRPPEISYGSTDPTRRPARRGRPAPCEALPSTMTRCSSQPGTHGSWPSM